MARKIGIDLDGVLIDHTAHKLQVAAELGFVLEPWQTNSNLLKGFLPQSEYMTLMDKVYATMTPDAPAVPSALEHLRELEGELYIVSARRLKTVRYAQQWLMKNDVFDIIPAERMFFCESKKDKRAICDRLGIGAFVDDQLAVLELLSPRMQRVLLDRDNVRGHLGIEEGYHVADDWAHVRMLVGAGIKEHPR